MIASPSFVLGLMLVIGDPAIAIETDQVDPDAAEQGLRLRLGDDALDGWSVTVRATDIRSEVTATLTSPDGTTQTRSIVLDAQTAEDRSRELASALALIIEQSAAPAADTETSAPRSEQRQRVPVAGWVGVGPRLGLGPPSDLDPDYGATVHGGLWVARDHVQPIVQVSWSRSSDAELNVDGIKFGAGLLAGAGLAGRRLWLGAGVIGRGMWVRGQDRQTETTWLSSTSAVVQVQYRQPKGLLIGLRTGAELTLPPLHSRGAQGDIRWGTVRWMIGATIGFHGP